MKLLLALCIALSSLSVFAYQIEPTNVYVKNNTLYVSFKNEKPSAMECKVYYRIETTKGEIVDNTFGHYVFGYDEATTWIRVDRREEGSILGYELEIHCKSKKTY